MKLFAPGEIIWDIDGDKRTIGGATYNFCGHAALMHDDAYLFSAVGHDENGDEALRLADVIGIRRDFIFRSDSKTGACLVTLDASGVPSYNVLRDTAYDTLALSGDDWRRLRELKCDCLYYGTLIQRSSSRAVVRELADSGLFREIFCDVNVRVGCTDRDSMANCLSHATLLKISDEEAHTVFDMGLAEPADPDAPYKDLARACPNLKVLIYTMGANGSLAYLPAEDRTVMSPPMRKCHVVSTVGAGDSYGAAFLHEYMKGSSIETCIERAQSLSAFVVEHQDAIPLGWEG